MEKHFIWLGYTCVDDLKGQDPQAMYEAGRLLHGGTLDRRRKAKYTLLKVGK